MAKVTRSAFNLVQNKIGAVVGTPSNSTLDLGYNLTPASFAVDPGRKVYGNDLNLIIQDANLVSVHQTGSETALQTVSPNKLIEATDLSTVATEVNTLYNNRTTAGPSQLSIVTSDSYSNGTPWGTSHTYRTRLDWGSNAEFRGWANLGGFLSVGVLMSGGSGSSQTSSWTNLFGAIGNVVFSGGASVQINETRAGAFPNGGLYNLLGVGQSGSNASIGFRILASDTNYTSNSFVIYIYPYGGTNTTNCTGVEILFQLSDNHVAPVHTNSDVVDGTLGISINTTYSFGKAPTVTSLGSTLG